MLLTVTVLAVPIVPFLVLGAPFEEQVELWFRGEMSAELRFGLIVALLASDLLLPVPSSMVSTYGGGVLGLWPAAAASWLGMTLGASIGFSLARALGRPFAVRRASAEDLDRMADLTRRFGPTALILTRAIPILAEACVLLTGATGMSWRRFLVPVSAANLVISVTYAAFGVYFKGHDALLSAVIASGLAPLAALWCVRRWLATAKTAEH